MQINRNERGSPVYCKCGEEAVFLEFQTFSYHYCRKCKVEVKCAPKVTCDSGDGQLESVPILPVGSQSQAQLGDDNGVYIY